MRKLILSELSAVIFFEPEESFLLKGIERGALRSANAQKLLDCAGINLPSENLYLELFEHDGKNILFISAAEAAEDGCAIYRFDCANDLMDAVKSVRMTVAEDDSSSLYALKEKYYLLICPPHAFKTKHLLEFGTRVNNTPSFSAYLREHGSLLSAPAALTELSKYFR